VVEGLAREVDVAAQPPQALMEAAHILQDNGKAEAAVRLLRRAQEAHPADFWINHTLGMALAAVRPPQPNEAIRFLTVAAALRPESPGTWNNLGLIFLDNGRLEEAIAASRKAIGLRRDYASPYLTLGAALERLGRLDEAIQVCREAIAHWPNLARAHIILGNVLGKRGDGPGAAACFRAALALDPKEGLAAYNLGNLLLTQGDLPGAAASYRRAIQTDPGYAEAHCNLGNVLYAQRDYPGAAACYRRAIQISPQLAEAHCSLGGVLLSQGDFRAALEATRTGHELGSRRKDWPYPSAQEVEQRRRFVELDRRLPAILKGEDHPAGTAERLELGMVCYYKGLHAAAAGFFTEAFAADPKLADAPGSGARYWAARSAVLAGRGPGAEAARLRRQALEWLRVDLARRAREMNAGNPLDRARLEEELRSWQTNPDLAGVRDASALAALPVAERAGWQQLWADVAATQVKARDRK
jgi:tetratricopeptide (TPR) repeat protein